MHLFFFSVLKHRLLTPQRCLLKRSFFHFLFLFFCAQAQTADRWGSSKSYSTLWLPEVTQPCVRRHKIYLVNKNLPCKLIFTRWGSSGCQSATERLASRPRARLSTGTPGVLCTGYTICTPYVHHMYTLILHMC